MGDLTFLERATWLNPPRAEGRDDRGLWVETGSETDFWRHTHYGFTHDNGHALLADVSGDFTAEAEFAADFTANFDQAGLMLWRDSEHWIKCGVELSDGILNLGAVVTRDRSDWSNVPMPSLQTGAMHRFRFTRRADAVAIEFRDGPHWRLIRLADFPGGPAKFGIMTCSPTRAGLRARFVDLRVGPPRDVVHAEE